MTDQTPTDITGQFDFWVGEWVCTGKSRVAPGKDEWIDTKATNSITKTLGGKVVEENFSMNSFIGQSHTVYDQARKIWRQTWVDNSGGYLVFEGGMDDARLILIEVSKPTETAPNVRQRMVFSDFKGDSFTWEWEGSSDGGKSWNLNWVLNYKRKK